MRTEIIIKLEKLSPMRHLYGLINGCVRGDEQRLLREWIGFLWPVVDSLLTGWLMGLDKISLRLVIGLITRHCYIRSLTKIWNCIHPNYRNV